MSGYSLREGKDKGRKQAWSPNLRNLGDRERAFDPVSPKSADTPLGRSTHAGE